MAATDEFADLERARELLDHATRLQYEAKHLIMAAITKRPSPQGQTSACITSTVPGISAQPNITLPQSVFRNPDPIRMKELWLEKERIREDIIAAEILRRRELEAEVRRELKLERELAIKTAPAEGLGTMRFAAHKNSVFEPFSFGTMPISEPVPNGFKSRSTAFDSFSLPLLMSEPVINGFMSSPPLLPPPSDLGNKNKLILLEKPNPNLSGGKRKSSPTVGSSELPPFGLKKKPREEWSCTLCQVSETTEKGLIQHINGKKHKAKEAELRAQQLDKSSKNAPSTQFSKPKETNGITSSKLEAKQVRKSLLDHNETGDGSGQKLQDQGTSKEDKGEPSMPEDQCGGDLKNKDKVETADGLERNEDVAKQSRFKFWCEMCQRGANNTKVMSQHMSGKKHNARSQKVTPKNVSSASSMVSAEASKEPEDADAAKEAHEKFNAIVAELMRAHNAVLAKETENTAEIIVANSDKPAEYNLPSASSVASAQASKEAGDADAAKEAHVKLNAR
ncbi:unnamed protein product [Malus baccata var. baccata]